jgi:uncharacterized protein YacL (UPF0231 family)
MVVKKEGIEITVQVEKDDEMGGHWEIERVRMDYVTLKQISQAIREIEEDESE